MKKEMTAEQIQQKVGKAVTALRGKKGMSKYKLALYSGLTNSQVTNIEQGKHAINLHTLIKLGKGFEIDFYSLIINALK